MVVLVGVLWVAITISHVTTGATGDQLDRRVAAVIDL
jgi:hypothetical protein